MEFWAFFFEDVLLVVVDVWRAAGAFDPGVGLFHGDFDGAERHAVLFGACGEYDAFELLGGFEEVAEHDARDLLTQFRNGIEDVVGCRCDGTVDVPHLLFRAFL